jgi:hypothetical protein
MSAIRSILPAAILCVASGFWSAAAGAATQPPPNGLFDRLIGTWDVRYEFTGQDGKAQVSRGQVQYSWILDGKALQEIWISDWETQDLRPYGTTINFYDPKRGRWTAIWIYPANGMTRVMTGGAVDDGWMLAGLDESGALERWTTRIAGPDSVVINAEISSDAGKTWRPAGASYLQRLRK